jgi:iron-sulfur cluster repair protein YtfE (RIC family)
MQKDKAFEKMELKRLSEYIEKTHHAYELSSLSSIEIYFNSLSEFDRKLNPNLDEIKANFQELMKIFNNHVSQEEKFVNTLLERIASIKISKKDFLKDFEKFKAEHNNIFQLVQKIKQLSNNYKVEENSSAILKLCFARLFDFEQDLLKHQYLEEQYLFPQILKRISDKVS